MRALPRALAVAVVAVILALDAPVPAGAGFNPFRSLEKGANHLAGEVTKATKRVLEVGRRGVEESGKAISGLGDLAESAGGDVGKALGSVLRDTGESAQAVGDTTASFIITGVAKPSQELVGSLAAASASLGEIDLNDPESIEEAVRANVAVGSAVVLNTERTLERAALDASSLGLEMLPEPAERGARHAIGEVIRELEKKNPDLAEWLRRAPGTSQLYDYLVALAGPGEVCRPDWVVGKLRTEPNRKIDAGARWASVLTTPGFKGVGISGWTATGCRATALGIAERDAAYSADDLVTLDLRLVALSVGGQRAPSGRFIRVEVLPTGRAREFVRYHRIRKGEAILVSGPVLMDNDPPHAFPEIHPIDDLEVVAVPNGAEVSGEAHFAAEQGHFLAPTQGGSPMRLARYEVQEGDTLERIAETFYGSGDWPTIYRANRALIRDPDSIQPGWMLNVPIATRGGLAAGASTAQASAARGTSSSAASARSRR